MLLWYGGEPLLGTSSEMPVVLDWLLHLGLRSVLYEEHQGPKEEL